MHTVLKRESVTLFHRGEEPDVLDGRAVSIATVAAPHITARWRISLRKFAGGETGRLLDVTVPLRPSSAPGLQGPG